MSVSRPTANPDGFAAVPAEEAVRAAKEAVAALYAGDLAAQALGIRVLEAGPGQVRVSMTVRADMLNGHRTCHGGILFTLADSAFAFACNSHGPAMVAAGASIEFLAPAVLGEELIAVARETSRGTRHGIYDVSVTGASGEPVAHFRGRCARLRAPSAAS